MPLAVWTKGRPSRERTVLSVRRPHRLAVGLRGAWLVQGIDRARPLSNLARSVQPLTNAPTNRTIFHTAIGPVWEGTGAVNTNYGGTALGVDVTNFTLMAVGLATAQSLQGFCGIGKFLGFGLLDGFTLQTDASGQAQAKIRGTNIATLTGSTDIADGDLHTLAVVSRPDDTQELYVDGRSVATDTTDLTAAIPSGTSAGFRLCSDGDDNNHLDDGALLMVALWNRVLSPLDIMQLGGPGGYPPVIFEDPSKCQDCQFPVPTDPEDSNEPPPPPPPPPPPAGSACRPRWRRKIRGGRPRT